LQDLIKEFDGAEDATDNLNKPTNFPVEDDEEVKIRDNRHYVKQERPQTYASTYASSTTKKKDEILDFRGASRLEIDKERCYKIWPKERLRLRNGDLFIMKETGEVVATIGANLTLKKGVKMVGRTDLEITDVDKHIYRLHFDTVKDAKSFVETEKARPSPAKGATPWFQLKWLLKKRSSRDLLESKGIIKNEPIFGNTLEELCDSTNPVPEVITRIVRLIEEPANITSLGLYRASANLAVVQNIRFEINCGRWEVLEKYRNEVDVLAGTLKLFFRELKRPLISYEVYELLRQATANPERKGEISAIVNKLPHPNRATLLYIIRHLLKVCQHKEHNKMDFHNLSICWGPSLITLPDNCTDLVTQTTEFTRIVEDLLLHYENQKIDDNVPKRTDFVLEVVRKLTGMIEGHLEVEGIYRKSGSNTKIDRIMKQLEKQNVNDADLAKSDIHDLCCVLKKFLSSLKDPLFPEDFYSRYFSICDKLDDDVLKHEVRKMVDAIPRRDALLVLVGHLNEVVRHQARNKMPIAVLSDIWMTTLVATFNVQNYKKKSPKFSKLFQILMTLNDKVLPDVVAGSGFAPTLRESKYDNVPHDIHDEAETFTKM
jgi:hypothetical protein